MITFIVADWPASSMQQHRLSGKSDRPQASNITTADNINHRSSISLTIFFYLGCILTGLSCSRKTSHEMQICPFYCVHIFCAGLHKLWYPGIRDRSTWGKFGAHGDVFLFSNLGALWFLENLIRYSLHICLREVKNNLFSFKNSYLRHFSWRF